MDKLIQIKNKTQSNKNINFVINNMGTKINPQKCISVQKKKSV